MKRPALSLAGFLAILVLSTIAPSPAHSEIRTVRVGLQNNPLLAFPGENGQPSGVFIDVLKHVASEQGWKLKWVPCKWSTCLTKLVNAEIDLMSAVAYSNKRAKKFDFTTETVFNNWSVVLQAHGHNLSLITDLEGLRVATPKGSINDQAFRRILKSFNIQSQIVEVDVYADVAEALQAGEVAAGIVNRLGALEFARHPSIEATTIIFNPVELRFTTTKGSNADLLTALDHAISALKAEKNSIYYASLDKWLFGDAQRIAVPVWIWWVLAVSTGILSFVFLWNRRLNKEVAERKQAEAEKEVLLKEIHHRVKNNLQVISGMLWVQANQEDNAHTVEVLQGSRRRVMLMAQIHESLNRQGDLNVINASEFLNALVTETRASGGSFSDHLLFHIDVDSIPLDVEHANTYGQIVSELISNAQKHGFPDNQPGNVEVSLHRREGAITELIVADDGKGLPKDFDFEQTNTLGLYLVRSLAGKLGGEVKINGTGGTRIQINFPENPS